MKKQIYKSGFAPIIIIVVIVGMVVVGVSGYLFYKNFVQKKSNNSIAGTSAKQKSDNNVYSDNNLSFEYPKTGWSTTTNTRDDPSGYGFKYHSVYLRSDDFKESGDGNPGSSANILEGTQISIVKNGPNPAGDNGPRIDTEVKSAADRDYYTDVNTIMVDGYKAYSYIDQFGSPVTRFAKTNYEYGIAIFRSDKKYDMYMAVYDLIRSTLKVK
ncbi:MAG: hypothetical protein WCK26_00230 [Candidatus Saccharibacteria bacterium]